MIKSAMQLKAKIRNVSGGDSKVAMTMMRIFFMERFLERVSLDSISESIKMKDMWNQFKKKNYFVEDIAYEDTVEVVKVLLT